MPCLVDVVLSVYWADWVGAFGRRRFVSVAKSLGLSVEGLVEYVAEQPPRAVGVARLLCKLANLLPRLSIRRDWEAWRLRPPTSAIC